MALPSLLPSPFLLFFLFSFSFCFCFCKFLFTIIFSFVFWRGTITIPIGPLDPPMIAMLECLLMTVIFLVIQVNLLTSHATINIQSCPPVLQGHLSVATKEAVMWQVLSPSGGLLVLVLVLTFRRHALAYQLLVTTRHL